MTTFRYGKACKADLSEICNLFARQRRLEWAKPQDSKLKLHSKSQSSDVARRNTAAMPLAFWTHENLLCKYQPPRANENRRTSHCLNTACPPRHFLCLRFWIRHSFKNLLTPAGVENQPKSEVAFLVSMIETENKTINFKIHLAISLIC